MLIFKVLVSWMVGHETEFEKIFGPYQDQNFFRNLKVENSKQLFKIFVTHMEDYLGKTTHILLNRENIYILVNI